MTCPSVCGLIPSSDVDVNGANVRQRRGRLPWSHSPIRPAIPRFRSGTAHRRPRTGRTRTLAKVARWSSSRDNPAQSKSAPTAECTPTSPLALTTSSGPTPAVRSWRTTSPVQRAALRHRGAELSFDQVHQSVGCDGRGQLPAERQATEQHPADQGRTVFDGPVLPGKLTWRATPKLGVELWELQPGRGSVRLVPACVSPPTDPDRLPNTGAPVTWWAGLVGLALVGAGLAHLVRPRRVRRI